MQAKFCHQPKVTVHYTFQISTHFGSLTFQSQILSIQVVPLAHLAKARDKLIEPLESHYTVGF